MKRRTVWTLRLIGWAATLTAVVLLIQTLALPRIVENRLAARLVAMGLNDVTFRVDRVGWTGAAIRDFRIGSGDEFGIDAIDVSYSAGGLVGGKVDTLTITGAMLAVDYSEGKLDLGPLARLRTTDTEGTMRFPFNSVELRSSRVVLGINDQLRAMPINGTLEKADELFRIRLEGAYEDQPFSIFADAKPGNRRLEITGLEVFADPRGFTASGTDSVVVRGGTRLGSDQPIIVNWDQGFAIRGEAIDIGTVTYDFLIGGKPVHIEPTLWRLLPIGNSALLSIADGMFLAAISAESQRGFHITMGNASVAADHIEVHLGAESRENARKSDGGFSVAGLSVNGKRLPDLSGELTVDMKSALLAAQWPIAEGVGIRVNATFSPLSIRASAELPSSDIDTLRNTLQEWIDIGDATVSGKLGATLAWHYPSTSGDSFVDLTLDDVAYKTSASGSDIQGVSGSLRIDLPTRTTPGGQTLSIARLEQGKLVLTDGTVRFRVEDANTIFIESMDWTLGDGGRITAHALRLNRDDPALDTELFVKDLNLADWLAVLTNEHVTATGNLYGRIPLRIRPRQDREGYAVAFGEGFLYSAPGTGTMHFADVQKVSDMLAQADPRFVNDPQLSAVRQRVADALSDFEYSMFRFDLMPQPEGDVTLRMQTRGKGRGPDGQEIGGLTVNFNNFQTAANAALFTRDLLGGVNQRLEQFFNPIERDPKTGKDQR